MKTGLRRTTYLKDYTPPLFEVSEIFLTVHLHDTETKVSSRLKVNKLDPRAEELRLQGSHLVLQSLKMNGALLEQGRYQIDGDELIIRDVCEEMELEVNVVINPQENTLLDGLYKSNDIFCTQCEPEGFRRITYFLDRPDAMSRFTTKIIADKTKYPVLLSNGNLLSSGDLEDNEHFAIWEDPFKKPSYLYALVAGDLEVVQDNFTTKSGRKIDLRIYVEKGRKKLCGHAMNSLKEAMKWDEERFNLEYDLDIYMIVAVDSFNMGAMENKGLNIFNSSCVLADPTLATDQDFLRIEGVIGHEYFHNWTGNRVTCRDWFQLTLKEGLTVFRDQEFSSDLNSRSVKRIQDVQRLQQFQFPEDQGPLSHPIRPESYIEMNNFYTATVYEKGAEVIRMIHTFIGEDAFQKGMKTYFKRYDGMAVRVEEFLDAMSFENDHFDVDRFKRWYFQKGTPKICVKIDYSPKTATLDIHVEQFPLEGQRPFYFPLNIGLIGENGQNIHVEEKNILHVKEKKETFSFQNISGKPVVSINRNFSAPIIVEREISIKDLCHIFLYDSDMLSRFQSAEKLARLAVSSLLQKKPLHTDYLDTFEKVLQNRSLDPAFKALCLSLPAERILYQDYTPVDVEGIFSALKELRQVLAGQFKLVWKELYEENILHGPYSLDVESMGKRALKNCALSYLNEIDTESLVYHQYKNANNMTDRLSALALLAHNDGPLRMKALDEFYQDYKHQTFVMQKWFSIQALSKRSETFDDVKKLEKSDLYDEKVPNIFRSLMGHFAHNYIHFHHKSGRGYEYVAQQVIKIDPLNPHMASALAQAFKDYRKFPTFKQKMMKDQLGNILDVKALSKNTFEIVDKILGETNSFS